MPSGGLMGLLLGVPRLSSLRRCLVQRPPFSCWAPASHRGLGGAQLFGMKRWAA